MCNINENHVMYGSEIWSATDILFCHLGPFRPFTLLMTENQNFEKMKKIPGDIITLHLYNINEDHMMQGS